MPVFVAVATIIFGGYFIVHIAPGRIPDIWSHVYRVSGITNGDILVHPVASHSYFLNTDGNVGGKVDRKFLDYSLVEYKGFDLAVAVPQTITVQDRQTADLPYNNSATNTPVAYLPQLVGFLLGKILNLSAGTTYYLAEILMLLVCAVCAGISVALLSRWRILVGLVMLLPGRHNCYFFAISADSFTRAMLILFVCMVFRTLYQRVTMKYCLVLTAVGALLALCKFIDVPLILVMLLVPLFQQAHHHNAAVNKNLVFITVGGTVAACAILAVWMKLNSWYTTVPSRVSYDTMLARKHGMLTNPSIALGVAAKIWKTIISGHGHPEFHIVTAIFLTFWTAGLYTLMMVIIATVKKTLPSYEVIFLWTLCILIIAIIILTYVALYLQYSPTYSAFIEGMQTRYIKPFFVPCTLIGLECLRSVLKFQPEQAAAELTVSANCCQSISCNRPYSGH